jgi:serine/threonine protein kinase
MANTERMPQMVKTERMNGSLSGFSQIITESIEWVEESTYKKYTIQPSQVGVGGESQVYEASFITDSGQLLPCVAKINTVDNLADEKYKNHRERTIDFLRSYAKTNNLSIMPLLASGSISVDINGETITFPIDIFPYYENGNMENKKLTYSSLMDCIDCLQKAIEAIHKQGFIHRDIKPQNIYQVYNGFVLGDFGTSTYIGAQDFHVTTGIRGTGGYRAPEIALRYSAEQKSGQGAVTIEADYFSLGFTLATLLLGEHPCKNLLGSEVAFDAALRKAGANGIELNLPEEQMAFQWLFTALTRYIPEERCDYEGVLLWMDNPDAFYQRYIAGYKHQEKSGWAQPFTIGDIAYDNERDLGLALAENWDEAKKSLYREQLYDHFKNINQTLANKLRDITEDQSISQDTGVAQAIHYILNGGEIFWCGLKFSDIKQIANYIKETRKNNSQSLENLIIPLLQSSYLSWKYKQVGDTSTEDVLMYIEIQSRKYPEMMCVYVQYAWADDEEVKDVYRAFVSWYENAPIEYDNLSENGWGWLAYLSGKPQTVLDFREASDKLNALEKNKQFYIFFYQNCDEKGTICKHYLKYSPDAYLPWIVNNLHLYQFNSTAAKQVRDELKIISVREDMSITEIQIMCDKIRDILNRPNGGFLSLFQDDFLIACLGLTKGLGRKGEITATNIDAFFIDTFMEQSVPHGFIKMMETVGQIVNT